MLGTSKKMGMDTSQKISRKRKSLSKILSVSEVQTDIKTRGGEKILSFFFYEELKGLITQ